MSGVKQTADYELRLVDHFSKGLAGVESKMNTFESKFSKIAALAGTFGIALGATAVIGKIKDTITEVISLGSEMEQTRIAFGTMLKSGEKGNAMIAQLRTFAEATPFRLDEVLQGSKSLLAYGFEAGEVTKQMTMMGDVSAGLGVPIGDLVYLMGTLKTQGRAMTIDIRQFAGRGIPIYDALAKTMGVNVQKVGEFVTAGKVGFKEVEKAFEYMTKKGSQFGGLMEAQSLSLSGRWSTFQDKLDGVGITLGEKMLPALKEIVEGMIEMVDLIPRLDFTPITTTLTQVQGQTTGLFTEMFTGFDKMVSKFSILQTYIAHLGFLMRVAWTPIRVGIQLWTQMVTAVRNSAGVFEGIGNVIEAAFNPIGAGWKAGVGLDKIKDSFEKMTQANSAHASKFIVEESQGWKDVFGAYFKGEKTDGSALVAGLDQYLSKVTGKGGAGAGKGTGKDGTAGVEKITSSTRNITINMDKLVGQINFQKSFGESENDLIEKIKIALLTSLNDVNIVAHD
jgi:hypothetical protein